MKILLLTDGIWPYVIGGMQKHSFFLCKYLAAQGVHVHLVHTNEQTKYDISQLEFFTEEEKRFITSTILPLPHVPAIPGHYLLRSFRYSKAIFDSIKNQINDYDFIYAKGLTSWYLLKQPIKRPKVGINIHGYEFIQPQANLKSKLESILLGFPFRFINKKADVVFSYGGGITDLIRSLGIPESKIISVPGAIERNWVTDSIQPIQGVRRFVFIGRFERRKGIQEINKVLSAGDLKGKFEFHFVGPIPKEHQLLSPYITYHGSIVNKADMQNILDNCHILVCPSYAEGMPNVILEGMARGCCIIATDVGAVRSFIDDEVGWLIQPGNVDQLKTTMQEALNLSEPKLDEKRAKSLSRVKGDLIWEKIIERTIKLIKEKIEGE